MQITITEGRNAPTVAQLRVQMAAAIERLIAVMDALDGDSDLEDTADDEPSLTWPEDQDGGGRRPVGWSFETDLEQEADDEPSLGSLGGTGPGSTYFSQEDWWDGANDDTEDEHDGREPDVDDEPSEDPEYELGATTAMNQDHAWANHYKGWSVPDGEPWLGWSEGRPSRGHPEMALRGYDDDREWNIGRDDRESDEAERGIADAGGLAEALHGCDAPGDLYGSGCQEGVAPADPWPMSPA